MLEKIQENLHESEVSTETVKEQEIEKIEEKEELVQEVNVDEEVDDVVETLQLLLDEDENLTIEIPPVSDFFVFSSNPYCSLIALPAK